MDEDTIVNLFIIFAILFVIVLGFYQPYGQMKIWNRFAKDEADKITYWDAFWGEFEIIKQK